MEFDRVDCFGKLSVRIPRQWVESSVEDPDTIGFFHPQGESGTLRVSLLTVKRTDIVDIDALIEEEFRARQEQGVRFFKIGEKIAVSEYSTLGVAADVYLYFWHLTAPATPGTISKAIFSYSVDPSRVDHHDFQTELQMIRDCVFATCFLPLS
jgi:hypothetical protein